MRVLIVSQYFWPEAFRINELAAELTARGHAVTVLTGVPNYPSGQRFPGYGRFPRAEEYRGVRVLRVPLITRGSARGARLVLNYLSFVVTASLLGPWLCRGAFDLIFVCQLSPVTVGLPALVLKRLKRAPILFWVLDAWPESLVATGAVRSLRVLGAVNRLVRFIYRHCDMIVVASRGFLPNVVAKGIPAERTGYLPNWPEQEYDVVTAGGPELPAGFRVVFAGNIGVAQDFDTILGAAERLRAMPDIQWIVFGDGRQFAWLQAQVAQRGLAGCFHLMGRHPTAAMPGVFHQADAMLITLRRDPAFAITVPGKLQSYMACGRPILAALDGEGHRLVAEAGAGLAVPAQDVAGLVDAILAMRRMPKAEREFMGARGRRYCDAHFNRELLMGRLEDWMKDLTDRS